MNLLEESCNKIENYFAWLMNLNWLKVFPFTKIFHCPFIRLFEWLFHIRFIKEWKRNGNQFENKIDTHEDKSHYMKCMFPRHQSFIVWIKPCFPCDNNIPNKINENRINEESDNIHFLILFIKPSCTSMQYMQIKTQVSYNQLVPNTQ